MKQRSWTVHEIRETRRDLAPAGALRILARLRTELPAPNTVTGAQRRHRLHVPTPDGGGTSVGAGWKLDGLLYPGFGVDTVGHVVVQARGGKTSSSTSVLANGQLVLQSDDDGLYAFSRAPAVLASSRVANVVGSGGVVLAAGFPMTISNAPVAGMRPDRPAADATLPAQMAEVVATWAASDARLTDSSAGRDAIESKVAPAKASKLVESFAASAALARATCETANVPGAAGSSDDGVVVVHGTGGFLVGTRRSGTIDADLGLVLASTELVAVGHETVNVFAGSQAKVRTKDLHLVGSEKAYLVSDTTAVVVANKGRAFLGAPGVVIGGFPGQVRAPQEPTKSIVAGATDLITIATEREHQLAGRGIWIQSSTVVEAHANERIRLIADDDVRVGLDREGKRVFARGNDAQIVLDGSGALIQHGTTGVVRARKTEVRLDVGPGYANVVVGTSGVRVKGTKIRIG